MSIQYRFPWIYELLVPIIHRKPVLRAFSRAVGKKVGVLDIAAGFGHMANFIDPSNKYRGIDLNKNFVQYARKRGRNVVVGDIFDPAAYRKHDVIILVDVIHHVPGRRLAELFDLVFKNATKRVVILEPSWLNLKSKYGTFGAALDWLGRKIDSDGINEEQRWLSELEYTKLFRKRFGSKLGKPFKLHIEKAAPYFVVTLSKD